MKKIIAIILAVVSVFTLTTTTAFAATNDTVKVVELTAHQYSSFEITIPERVDLTATNGNIEITVDSLDLEPNYQLGVLNGIGDSYVTMSRSDGETAKLYLYDMNGQKITNTSTPLATFFDVGSATIKAELEKNAKAGEYSGYLRLEIFAYSI